MVPFHGVPQKIESHHKKAAFLWVRILWVLWVWQEILCEWVKFQMRKTSNRHRKQQGSGGGALSINLASGWSQVCISVMKTIFWDKNFKMPSHLKGTDESMIFIIKICQINVICKMKLKFLKYILTLQEGATFLERCNESHEKSCSATDSWLPHHLQRIQP